MKFLLFKFLLHVVLQVPVLIPVIVGTQNIFLFIMPLVSSPDAKYLAGLACIGLGFLLYFGIIYKKTTLPKMGEYITYTTGIKIDPR